MPLSVFCRNNLNRLYVRLPLTRYLCPVIFFRHILGSACASDERQKEKKEKKRPRRLSGRQRILDDSNSVLAMDQRQSHYKNRRFSADRSVCS